MLTIRTGVQTADLNALITLLHDADEDDERTRTALTNPAYQTFTGWLDDQLVGVAVVDWRPGVDSEILYIAVDEDERGRGYGRQIIEHVTAELPRHSRRLIVGTANSSLDNIAFYQRCGFRMSTVRRDYFAYIDPEVTEFNIPLRDMIVFSYEQTGQQPAQPAEAVEVEVCSVGDAKFGWSQRVTGAGSRAGGGLTRPTSAGHREDVGRMRTPSLALFCDTGLAHRVERAEVDLIRAVNAAARQRQRAGFLVALAGGVASYAGEGSPYNKVAGLGFSGIPDQEELDEIERAFASHGAPTQIELAHIADPAVGELLTRRGYRLESFENVLGRSLDESETPVHLPDVVVRRSPEEEFDAWLSMMADSVAQADAEGLPWHEEFPRAVYEDALRDDEAIGVRRYAAIRNGTIAGGAGLRIVDGIAQFAGAATAPAHRRHGIQNALLATRLDDARADGSDLAVIVTQPGSKSQQNAQRRGFHLLYTRAVLVKPALT